MKHSYFSNLFAINFSVVETVCCLPKINLFVYMYLLYKVTNLTLYILVHRNILMYVLFM